MNLLEAIRGAFTDSELLKLGSAWNERRAVLLRAFSSQSSPTRREVLDVGLQLSEAFQLEGQFKGNSDQSSLSRSGTIWQILVTYYLNLCLAGTSAIAVRSRFVPPCVKDALRIVYTSNRSAKIWADIDLVVLYSPRLSEASHQFGDSATDAQLIRQFHALVTNHFSDLSMVLVQTKTNWNDNAQIPMLWNMVYKNALADHVADGFSVGANNWHLLSSKGLTYSFVTVPSNKLKSFGPNSAPVARVAGMTGGAYWGRPSAPGIILGLNEFFITNFNALRHHFPAPDLVGSGYASEVITPSGRIARDAFRLL